MSTMSLRLDGRVSVVTGAAQGIGRACSEALAAAGSRVAMCDINAAAVEATAREIAEEAGVETRSYALNVADQKAVNATIAQIAADFGAIDHLVNNAGVQFISSIAEFPDEQWERVRTIDLDSIFYSTKAVWPHLVARGRGRIVNLASVQGLIASLYKPAYITANAICPGAVMTDLIKNQARGLAEQYGGGISDEEALARAFLAQMPTKRFIQPEEVGALCAYLCSDAAKSITGAPISIDGGWFAS